MAPILKVGQLGTTPVPVAANTHFVTLEYLRSLGLNPDQISAQTVADANLTYTQIQNHPWVTQDDLAAWAASTWPTTGAIDRLNLALQLLQEAGVVATVT